MGALSAKRAVISGGSSGIGRATAVLFSREGASVAILDIDKDGGQATAYDITSVGDRAVFISCDVSLAHECQSAVNSASEHLGGIDILVNSAGIISRNNILKTTESEWDSVMDTNAKSVFLLAKYAIPFMIDGGGGAIVNIGSGWGLVGGPDALAYCASKGAVVNMTRAMAIDHGHQHIRVNCVCPGDTDTPLLRQEAQQLGQDASSFLERASHRPLGRVGTPEDIAQAVLYLASDLSSYVTGSVLVVDGGGLAGG